MIRLRQKTHRTRVGRCKFLYKPYLSYAQRLYVGQLNDPVHPARLWEKHCRSAKRFLGDDNLPVHTLPNRNRPGQCDIIGKHDGEMRSLNLMRRVKPYDRTDSAIPRYIE